MPTQPTIDRRQWLIRAGAFAGASLLLDRAAAQKKWLPLRTSGLDHLSITVPDSAKAATFYGRIFDPQVFKERTGVQRYYCRLGAAYIAFGPRANVTPFIDHISAAVIDLVEEDFGKADTRAEFTAAGITPPTGSGSFALVPDPDGLQLQPVSATHGLFDTLMPGGRVTTEQPALFPIGLDHIMLAVSDLEKSAAHYRKLLGQETRERNPDRVWFKLGDSKIGLEAAPAGQKPNFSRFCVKVAGFDRSAATARLEKLGLKVEPGTERGSLRFLDLHNIPVEVTGG